MNSLNFFFIYTLSLCFSCYIKPDNFTDLQRRPQQKASTSWFVKLVVPVYKPYASYCSYVFDMECLFFQLSQACSTLWSVFVWDSMRRGTTCAHCATFMCPRAWLSNMSWALITSSVTLYVSATLFNPYRLCLYTQNTFLERLKYMPQMIMLNWNEQQYSK